MQLPPRLQTFAVALVAAATLSSVAMRAQHPSPDLFAPLGIANSLTNLADQPATHTGVVFDRSMIQMAQGMLQQTGMDADRAAAALTSISFDSYRYREPAFYTPETMAGDCLVVSPCGLEAPGQQQPDAGQRSPADNDDHRSLAALLRHKHRPRHRADARSERHEPCAGCRRSAASGPHPPKRALRNSQGRSERRHGSRPRRPLVLLPNPRRRTRTGRAEVQKHLLSENDNRREW